MDINEVSIDQVPPISAPVRFFLTAPLFGILAGFLILFSDTSTLKSRYAIDSIVITHSMAIGFFGFIMLGAMIQMLPVLTGVKIAKVDSVSRYSHALLSIGTIAMLIGIYVDSSLFNIIAFFSLGSGFLIMLISIALSLRGVTNITATVRGIVTSLGFAFAIVVMGLFLLYSYITNDITTAHMTIANIHSVWAIFGFCGILIIGVAFQVLPMFYVAPKFKPFCKKRVIWLIYTGLLAWMFLSIFYEEYALYAKLWIATFFWAFATAIWVKMNARRRPVSDVTVWYWRNASVFLTLGAFLWIFDEYFKHEYIVMVGILIGGGFILSIMIGMLYKIVPSLVWIHLNAKGYINIPAVNEMIDIKLAKLQFVFLVLALIGFLYAFYFSRLLQPSAISFIISMILLEYNIILPILIYKKKLKTKPDFDMSVFES